MEPVHQDTSDQVYTQLFAEIHYKKYTSKFLKIQSPTLTIPMFFWRHLYKYTSRGYKIHFIYYQKFELSHSNSHRRSNVEHTCLVPIIFFFHLPYLQDG
jgi:hypothetical protein